MNRRNLNNANTYMSTRVGGQRSPWYNAAPEDTAPEAGIPDASKQRDTELPGPGDGEKLAESGHRRYRPAGPLLL